MIHSFQYSRIRRKVMIDLILSLSLESVSNYKCKNRKMILIFIKRLKSLFCDLLSLLKSSTLLQLYFRIFYMLFTLWKINYVNLAVVWKIKLIWEAFFLQQIETVTNFMLFNREAPIKFY